MTSAVLATLAIALILVVSEYLWRKMRIKGEIARKFVHIIAGSFIAFLPFWVSYGWITVLSIGFIAANFVNHYTPIFHAIHAIKRRSWGDLLFGVGIFMCAVVKPNKWIFAGAILQVAFADGLAAVIGSTYSKRKYRIFDHYKSVLGSFTFLASSMLISLLVVYVGGYVSSNAIAALILIPSGLTVLENISGYGTDNVILPVTFLLAVQTLLN